MAKKTKQKKQVKSERSFLKRFFGSIGNFFKKITAPIRKNKTWKFLRRTILRSPFRGYFIGAFRELRKVTWPNRATTWKLTVIVFLFSAVFAAFTTALDYGLERIAKQVFLR